MNLRDVIAELRELNEEVPKPLRLPTEAEVAAVENRLGVKFHPDYRQYLLEASDVVFGALEPAIVIPDAGHLSLIRMVETARDEMEVPRNLLPFCEDNSDYYCLTETGAIEFWAHDGTTDDKWPDLATWIKEVWIGSD